MKFYAALIILAVAYCVMGICQVNRAHDRRIASGEITFSEQCREMDRLVKVTEYERGWVIR